MEIDEKTKKRLRGIWHDMKTRCTNPNSGNYGYYGGRGIHVCEEWTYSFRAFCKWALGNGYADGLTLDRKNVDGDYEPSNCHWVDQLYQNNHTRKNHYIEHNGETKTAAEWARQYGVHRCVFNNRIRRGWTFERAIDPQKQRPGRH